MLQKHPDKSFDRFYGEEPKLQYAEHCDSYIKGCGVFLCVECSIDELDPEDIERVKKVEHLI